MISGMSRSVVGSWLERLIYYNVLQLVGTNIDNSFKKKKKSVNSGNTCKKNVIVTKDATLDLELINRGIFLIIQDRFFFF